MDDVAAELRGVIRLAGRNPEALEGRLPGLTQFARVTAAGELEESARTYLILQHLIPEYLERLPGGPECRAIRELLTWEDSDGALQSLTTRYHKAAAHLVGCASDFGRRQEPRLLRECARRFIALDHEDRLAAPARVAGAAHPPATSSDPADCALAEACDPSSGIVGVHRNLDYHRLVDLIADAQQITILNTWIPGLDILADTLVDALARGSAVSILLLDPASRVSQLRSQALQRSTPGRFQHDRVGPGVRHCLDVLSHISQSVDGDRRHNLRVRLYDTLPSISAYAIDERTFMSFFTHGQLAVKSVQIEILGRSSIMGQLVSRELDTLWNMSHECQPALDAA
ncbi:MAG TPA: hypothetical protein VFZ89_07315 [Solirubrobacteraceae bacterium]